MGILPLAIRTRGWREKILEQSPKCLKDGRMESEGGVEWSTWSYNRADQRWLELVWSPESRAGIVLMQLDVITVSPS